MHHQTGVSQVQGRLSLESETLSQKKKKKKREERFETHIFKHL
jgi:hypothetical protein